VDLRASLFYLEESHTKSAKRRSVPLNEAAREAMLSRARFRAEHCPASPWAFCRKDGGRLTTLRRSFGEALRRAGIEDFRQHDQRHACAVFMLREGATLPQIRDVLGHSSVKMTERYAHLEPEFQRDAVERIKGVSRRGEPRRDDRRKA
jgi:site-specific recombinase XerD